MPDFSNLSAILASLSGIRMLVVGDVMLDRFITGRIERISPADSNPVVRSATRLLQGALFLAPGAR